MLSLVDGSFSIIILIVNWLHNWGVDFEFGGSLSLDTHTQVVLQVGPRRTALLLILFFRVKDNPLLLHRPTNSLHLDCICHRVDFPCQFTGPWGQITIVICLLCDNHLGDIPGDLFCIGRGVTECLFVVLHLDIICGRVGDKPRTAFLTVKLG